MQRGAGAQGGAPSSGAMEESEGTAVDLGFVLEFLSSQTTYDYLSVIVGGITGALFACDRNLDIVGTVTLGLMTGYGGGVVRDILLENHGFYFMQHADLVLITAAICAFVFFFQGLFKHLDATVFFADALSVGLFALAGASKAVSCDVGFVYAVLLGAITAVGGGAIRDICVGEVPGVFKESNFYAVAGIGGAFAYVGAVALGSPALAASLLCVFTVVALRYWSVYFDWRTSAATDLTPVLSRTVKGIFLHGSSRRRRQRFRGIFHAKRQGAADRGEGKDAAAGDFAEPVRQGVREEEVEPLGYFATAVPKKPGPAGAAKAGFARAAGSGFASPEKPGPGVSKKPGPAGAGESGIARSAGSASSVHCEDESPEGGGRADDGLE